MILIDPVEYKLRQILGLDLDGFQRMTDEEVEERANKMLADQLKTFKVKEEGSIE